MANPRIEVEIGANVTGLTTGVNTATGQLDKLGKAASATAPQVQKLTQATSSYNSVGTDFARIIQDAPFGIIGVGNNITQLAGSFQQLKNSTGSTGGAVKAALASILSPANALVLGISVLTTALTVLQMQGFFKTEEAAKSLADQLNKYKDTLNETAQAQLEGAANADKEIIKIQSLRSVIEDETVSRDKRLAAVQKLRAEAPTIFKNLSDEQILAGKVGDSYNRLTQILVARATAASGINKIVALADEERLILEKNAEVLQKISSFEQKAANFRAQGQQELVLINENQIRYLKQQNPELQRLADIEAERVKLTALVNQNLIASVDYNDKSAASASRVNDESQKLVRTYEDLTRLSTILDRAQLERLDKFSQGVEAPITITSGKAETQGIIQPDVIPNQLNDQALTFNSNLQTIGETINELTAGFGGLGGIIGSAFGNNPKLGQFIAQFVGFAAKLIATNFAIASSNAVAGASSSALATGPAAAFTLPGFIAASVGLIAGAFAAFGGGGKKGSGGGGGGGGGGGAGVGGGSSFTGGGAQGGLFEQNRDVSGEFVVRGSDLVYVLGQANNRINKG
jgi:hypothetical protein